MSRGTGATPEESREKLAEKSREPVKFQVSRAGVVVALMATTVLVTLGLASFHEGTARSRPVVPPFELFWCETDADCTIVDRIGCCPCQQGGGQAAVTQWRQDDLRRFLKGACQPKQVCVQVNLCRTDMRPRCVNRQCSAERSHE